MKILLMNRFSIKIKFANLYLGIKLFVYNHLDNGHKKYLMIDEKRNFKLVDWSTIIINAKIKLQFSEWLAHYAIFYWHFICIFSDKIHHKMSYVSILQCITNNDESNDNDKESDGKKEELSEQDSKEVSERVLKGVECSRFGKIF